MKVLLLDDDRFVLASLTQNIDWEKLGFDHVYTARNIAEAGEILSNSQVDLLLSDIDMPNGSGLDLLTWIRENQNDMPVIFLTNYADFEYAQKAVSLKSFHYFLKPIEFDKLIPIIQEATRQLSRQSEQMQKNCESFWHSFLNDEILQNGEDPGEYLSRAHLPYKDTDFFVPVAFDLFPYSLTAENELANTFTDHSDQVSYMKSTFRTVFLEELAPTDVFLEYHAVSARYLAVFRLEGEKIPSVLSMNCERFIQTVLRERNCVMNAFVGVPSTIGSFREHLGELCSMMTDCLDYDGRVQLLSEYRPVFAPYQPCDSTTLELYLSDGQYSAFLDYCSRYLKQLSRQKSLYAESLDSFQIDVEQTIYAFLLKKGILANKLFHDETCHFLSRNARKSLSNMILYIQYLIGLTKKYLEQQSDKSIAQSIQAYVDAHYAEDISWNMLTDIFFLDPDYASRLFKNELGISFKNYLIQKRIDVAKNLLVSTDLPINTIADHVGYGNYSYFTRIFKKVTGMTPVEYRNRPGKRPEEESSNKFFPKA